MKIEVGKKYQYKGVVIDEVKKRFEWYSGAMEVVELSDDETLIFGKTEEGLPVKTERMSYVKELKYNALCDNEELPSNTPSKPAHYDTAIDTIAFAKANLSREAVEGFMRINAIKYLQRSKGQNLSDLKKCRHYLDMLIEMEEEQR